MCSGAVLQDQPMNSIANTPKNQPRWFLALRDQGRTMSWLARATGKTYPQVWAYQAGRAKVPPEWLAQVVELLGEEAA